MIRGTNFANFSQLLSARLHYRRLVLGGVVSQLGDWLSYIALSYIAVRNSGEEGEWGVGLSIAMIYLAHSLPNAFAAPFVGPIVDRYNRRGLIITSYLSASLLTLLIWTQVNSGSLLMIQALLCARVIASNLGMTARQAALPTLVKPEELYTANALNSSVWSTLFTLGVALGGVISTLLGPSEAILIDSFTYLLSCVFVWWIPDLSPDDPAGKYAECSSSPLESQSSISGSPRVIDETSQEISTAIREEDEETVKTARQHSIIDAIRFVRTHPSLSAPLIAKSFMSVFNSAGWIALNVIAMTRHSEMSALFIGLFTAARGLGMGVGPAALRADRPIKLSPAHLVTFSAVSLFLWSHNLWVSILALFLWGVGNGINWVTSTAILQSETPPNLQGRMTSLDFLCFTTSQSILTLAAGWIYDQYLSLYAIYLLILTLGTLGILTLFLLERRPKSSSDAVSSKI